MGKLLLLLLVVLAFIYLIRKSTQPAARRSGARPRQPDAEQMVSCRHCGVYLPVSEALQVRGAYFCCEQHRRLASD